MLTSVLIILVLFAGLMLLVMLYWQRIVDGGLTAHFRAAESISEGYLPEQWAKQINRQLGRPWLSLRKQTGTELALKKVDKLHRFFEASTFFEDEAAKTLLLNQLTETHQRWQTMSWDELQQLIQIP